MQTTTLTLLHLSRVLATIAGVVYLRLKAEERVSEQNRKAVSEQNRKAVSFIERFVTEVPISTQQSIRLYLCKPCFSRVDKARRAAEEAEKLSTRLESRFVVVHLLQSNL